MPKGATPPHATGDSRLVAPESPVEVIVTAALP